MAGRELPLLLREDGVFASHQRRPVRLLPFLVMKKVVHALCMPKREGWRTLFSFQLGIHCCAWSEEEAPFFPAEAASQKALDDPFSRGIVNE